MPDRHFLLAKKSSHTSATQNGYTGGQQVFERSVAYIRGARSNILANASRIGAEVYPTPLRDQNDNHFP